MRIAIHSLFCSMVLMLCFGIASAQTQDDSTPPYPPITAENAQQLQIVQLLAKGTPLAFSWSPDSTRLTITAEGGTWIYDMTDESLPSYQVTGHNLSPRILYAPHHPIYVSYDSHYDCIYRDCEHEQKIYVRDVTTHEILHEIERGLNTVVQFSPDGLLMAVLSRPSGIRIWETESFLTQTAENPDEFMRCRIDTPAIPVRAFFSPDGSSISYTGYYVARIDPDDTSIWFWDTYTCEVQIQEETLVQAQPDIRTVPLFATFTDYSHNGRYLITPQWNEGTHHQYLWNMDTFEKIAELPMRSAIIRFSYDSQHILFQDEDRIKFWEIASRTVVKEYIGNNAFYLDDGTLVIIRGNHFVLITDEGERAFPEYRYPITNFHLSADGRWLLSRHDYRLPLLWDMEQATLVGELDRSATFSPDGKYLVWKRQGVSILELETQALVQLDEFVEISQSRYWSTSDKILVTYLYTYSPDLDVWSYHTGTFERLLRIPNSSQRLKAITDAYIILSTTEQLQFLDIYTGEQVASMPISECAGIVQSNPYCEALVNAHPIDDVGYSDPNIRRSRDGTAIEVLHKITGEVIDTYPLPSVLSSSAILHTFRVNADGDLLATSGSDLYNITQNRLLMSTSPLQAGTESCSDCEPPTDIPFYYKRGITWISEDASFLLSRDFVDISMQLYYGFAFRVWDINTTEELYHINFYNDSDIELSSDMQWVFELEADYSFGNGQMRFFRRVNVFDGRTGNHIANLPTFRRNASSASFSPDNRFLLIHSDTMRVWAVVPEDD